MSFESLDHILRAIRNRYPALSKKMTEAEALARWETAVGPQIARHARAVRVQDGVLWVEVDHPIWKSELHHRKRQILDRLNGTQAAVPTGGTAKNATLTDLLLVEPRA